MASLLRWSSGPVRLLLVSMLCLRECWSSSMSGHQRRCFWDNTRRTTRCVHKDGSSWLSTPAAQQVKQNNTGKEPSRARRSEEHARQISAKCASLDDCTGVNMYKYGIMADLEPWLQTGITQQAADLGSSWQVLKTNWSAERTSMCECTYVSSEPQRIFVLTSAASSIKQGFTYQSFVGTFMHLTWDSLMQHEMAYFSSCFSKC